MAVRQHEASRSTIRVIRVVLEEVAQRTWAMSAMPSGHPDVRICALDASMESARMQLASSRRVVI